MVFIILLPQQAKSQIHPFAFRQPTTIKTAFLSTVTYGTARNDFTGWVGYKFTPTTSLTVSTFGRLFLTGNTGTHSVKIYLASDNTVLGTVSIAMTGGTNNQFKYVDLTTPVTLTAGTNYFIASQETNTGDSWYNNNTYSAHNGVAYNLGSVYSADAVTWSGPFDSGSMYDTVDFKFTTANGTAGGAGNGDTPVVSSTGLGTSVNNVAVYVGMQINVAGSNLTVTSLGRMCLSGNTLSHHVKLVTASNGNDVSNGSVIINMNGCTAGQFSYVDLPSSVTLNANTNYYLVTLETMYGDSYYNDDTSVTITGAVTVPGPVYGSKLLGWTANANVNHSYGPTNMKYH